MNMNARAVLIAGLIGVAGFGLIRPALADTMDAWNKDKAAYDARCNGVTVNQATLYLQCTADKTKLDDRLKNIQSGGTQIQTRGGTHTVGGDE